MRSRLLIYPILLAVSIAFRAYALGRSSFWYDEMVTLSFIENLSWHSIFYDNSPFLHQLLLNGWVQWFGTDEVATRSLSVVFSAGATVVVAAIGYELRGVAGAIAAGLFHALSYLSVTYAQEARVYAQFEFFMALNLLFYLRIFYNCRTHLARAPVSAQRKSIVLFWASAIFLCLSHYFAIIPLFTEGLLFVFQRYRRRGLRRSEVVGLCGGVVVTTAVLVFSYVRFFQWQSVTWQETKYHYEPLARIPVEVLSALFNHSWFCAGAVGILAAIQLSSPKGERRVLGALVIVPIVLVTVVGIALHRALLMERYFVFLVPPFTVWLGVAIVDLWVDAWRNTGQRYLYRAISVATVAVYAIALPRVYIPYKADWREAAEVVHRNPALVLTVNKPAVRYPYFDKYHLEVRQWVPGQMESTLWLHDELLRRGKVWLVDLSVNAGYFSSVRKWAELSGFQASEQVIATGDRAAINLLLLEN